MGGIGTATVVAPGFVVLLGVDGHGGKKCGDEHLVSGSRGFRELTISQRKKARSQGHPHSPPLRSPLFCGPTTRAAAAPVKSQTTTVPS